MLIFSIFFNFLIANTHMGNFAGHVVKINPETNILRISVNFPNYKYLPKAAHVKLWLPTNPASACLAVVKGKSTKYLLLKVIRFKSCLQYVPMSIGTYIRMYSEDLSKNVALGKDLMEILVKKELALSGMVKDSELDYSGYDKKLQAINEKYTLLRDQLYAEWDREITALEEDKSVLIKHQENLDINLLDTRYKLEKYRVDDDNFELDKWSLDPNLYYAR